MAALTALTQIWRHFRRTGRRFGVRICAVVTLLSFVMGTVGIPLGHAQGGGSCCGKSGKNGCPCCKAGRPCNCGCSCSSKKTAVAEKLPSCCAKRKLEVARHEVCCGPGAFEKLSDPLVATVKKAAVPRLPTVGGCPCGKGPMPGYILVTHPRWIDSRKCETQFELGYFFALAPSSLAPHVGSRPPTPPPKSLPC